MITVFNNKKIEDSDWDINSIYNKFPLFFKNYLLENNLKYQTYQYNLYNHHYKCFDYCFNISNDKMGILISKLTDRWYSTNIAESLAYKHKLSNFLSRYNFNELQTYIISSIDDIKMENFIIKPILGTGKSPQFGTIFSSENVYGNIAYKKFKNIDDLLSNNDKKKLNELFQTKKLCIQEACMDNNHQQISIHGTVNERSQVVFCRPSIRTFIDSNKSIVSRKFNSFKNEIDLIRNFISLNNIKNCGFMLQFIIIKGKNFPMDWNLRLGSTAQRWLEIDINPNETNNLLNNVFDMSHVENYSNDEWITKETWIKSHYGTYSWNIDNIQIK